MTEKFLVKLINSIGDVELVFKTSSREEAIQYVKENILNVEGAEHGSNHSDTSKLEVYIDREVYDEEGEIIEDEIVLNECLFDYSEPEQYQDIQFFFEWSAEKQETVKKSYNNE